MFDKTSSVMVRSKNDTSRYATTSLHNLKSQDKVRFNELDFSYFSNETIGSLFSAPKCREVFMNGIFPMMY